MTIDPDHRWFAFSLRTMFIVVAIAAIVLAARCAWKPQWIRQRHELLAKQEAMMERLKPGVLKRLFSSPSTAPLAHPNWTRRTIFWVFGEPEVAEVRLLVPYIEADTHTKSNLSPDLIRSAADAAQALFPEATITVRAIAEDRPLFESPIGRLIPRRGPWKSSE